MLIAFTAYTWLKNNKNRIEFYILLLSSVLGVYTMISSGHILTLYLGLEMSTIPLAALANFNKSQKNSSEAGLKLILSSAFSTGIMLFGISLLYGAVGNLGFEYVAAHLQPDLLTLFAFTFIVAGFAFKMSIVPFHLWTADVYEGSPVSITSFLSVISKGSVIFVFVSVLYTLFAGLKEAWVYEISITGHSEYDCWKSFCHAATECKAVACLFLYLTGWICSGGYCRCFHHRNHCLHLFRVDIHDEQYCSFRCYWSHIRFHRKRKPFHPIKDYTKPVPFMHWYLH